MAAKAKLTILLKADETIVAEVDDPILWQRVLAAISQGESSVGNLNEGLQIKPPTKGDNETSDELGGNDNIAKFARRLGVSVPDLTAAFDPLLERPYLRLDSHYWEAFKKNFPSRGTGSVSSVALVGTALALWLKEANLQVAATQAIALEILATIHVRDPNASRGISNTKWLQARSGGIITVNPAEVSKACEVVRAFCLKKAPGTES